jgi:hypothetical protein
MFKGAKKLAASFFMSLPQEQAGRAYVPLYSARACATTASNERPVRNRATTNARFFFIPVAPPFEGNGHLVKGKCPDEAQNL